MAVALPKTAESAPPNFYNQVGAMAAGAGGSSQAGGAAGGKQGKVETEFLEAATKLLKVFEKMETMKPNGQDVSKQVKAAADAINEAMKVAYGSDAQSAAGEGAGADTGDQGGAAGNSQAAAGAAGAGSETQQPAAA